MGYTVKVTMAQLPGRLRRLHRKLEKAMIFGAQKGAKKIPNLLRKSAAATTPYPPEAFGKYRRGWRVEIVPKGARISNEAKYAQFVEWGRGPGKGPPIQALIKWMMLKRFNIGKRQKGGKKGMTALQKRKSHANKAKRYIATRLAWALFWKIKKHGIKGRYVIRRALPQITRAVGHGAIRQMKKVRP